MFKLRLKLKYKKPEPIKLFRGDLLQLPNGHMVHVKETYYHEDGTLLDMIVIDLTRHHKYHLKPDGNYVVIGSQYQENNPK